MSFLSNKIKVIQFLFVLAILFLAANLIFDKLGKNNIYNKSELSVEQINSRFETALLNLGIAEDWIKRKKGGKEPVSLIVQVPDDLPIALILQELNIVFKPGEADFHSVEKKIGGKSVLSISQNGETKLSAEFNYNNKIKRKSVRVGFLVTGFEKEKEPDSLLLNYPEAFSLILTPSKSSAGFVKNINRFNKEYVVYLSDNIEELDFKLSDKYSNQRLKNSIRSIVGSFSKAVFFLVDDNSSLYSSLIYPFIKEEIEKRKIRLVKQSEFKSIISTAEEDLITNFRRRMDDLTGGEDVIFFISSDDLISLQSIISDYRKRGYKFIKPSALLF